MSPCPFFPLINQYFYKKLSLYIQIPNIYLGLGFEFEFGPKRIRNLAFICLILGVAHGAERFFSLTYFPVIFDRSLVVSDVFKYLFRLHTQAASRKLRDQKSKCDIYLRYQLFPSKIYDFIPEKLKKSIVSAAMLR